MANWQRKIKLNPWWDQAKDGTITIQVLSSKIADKIAALPKFNDSDIDYQSDELVDSFRCLACEEEADRDDFDCLMSELYEWGDMRLDDKWNGKTVCWIDTMSPA